MNSRKALLVIILALLLSSCSSLEAYFEQSSVTVVSPQEGFRHTDILAAGQPLYVPLVLKLLSSNEDPKTARIYINSLGPVYCILTPNIEKDCGQIPVIQHGDQIIRIEIDIMDGDTVYRTQTYTSTFSWVPYEGWWDLSALKLAKVFDKNTPESGYKLFALILVVVLSLVSYFLSRRSVFVSFLGGWSSLVLLAIIYAFSGSLIGQSVAFTLGVICVVSAFCCGAGYYIYLHYEQSLHTVPLPPRGLDSESEIGEDSDTVNAQFVDMGDYLPMPYPNDQNITI